MCFNFNFFRAFILSVVVSTKNQSTSFTLLFYSMTVKYNNATIYGIQEDVERYLWLAYLIIVLISSLIGDTIVLIASTKYNAFKLNKSIVAVIQHMAVCDLVITTTFVLPTIIAMILDKWVMGDTLANTHRFIEFWALPVCNVLVGVLTTSKFLLVRYPLQTRNWTSNKSHVVCCLVWCGFAAISVTSLLLCNEALIFDFTSYEFDADYSRLESNAGKFIDVLISTVNFISILVVMVTTVFTLQYLSEARKVARRSTGSLRWQGVVTVMMTGSVYCVSSLPYAIYTMMEHFVKDPSSPSFVKFERSSEWLTLLNVMSNFYIYSLTIPSFRRFLRTKVLFFKDKLVPSNKIQNECQVDSIEKQEKKLVELKKFVIQPV